MPKLIAAFLRSQRRGDSSRLLEEKTKQSSTLSAGHGAAVFGVPKKIFGGRIWIMAGMSDLPSSCPGSGPTPYGPSVAATSVAQRNLIGDVSFAIINWQTAMDTKRPWLGSPHCLRPGLALLLGIIPSTLFFVCDRHYEPPDGSVAATC